MSTPEQQTLQHSPQLQSATVKRPRIDAAEAPVEISRGAEGLVTRIAYLGRSAVRKERFPKRYRHPELDAKLTSRRLAQEARVLLRLRKSAIRVPAVYAVDLTKHVLILEDLGGSSLKTFLQRHCSDVALCERVMRAAGLQVARMHQCGVVHGDLTTGNIMISGNDEQICLIDFGLSGGNVTEEDMAVDLYVFERAVISAHSETAEPLNGAFLDAYRTELNDATVMGRLQEVRSRGRKRDMTG